MLLWIFFMIFISARAYTNSEGVALYDHVGPDLGLNTSTIWNYEVSPCQGWRYVSCDSDDHVITLSLGSLELNGTLNDFIGNLSYLQKLNLSNNQIRGTLPSTIGKLVNLVNLDLSNNKFSGTIPAGIPSPNNLNMSNNQFSGPIPISLVSSSAHCSESFLNMPNLCSNVCGNIKACPGGTHPPPSLSPPPPPTPSTSGSSSNSGPLIGGLVGVIVGLALAALVIVWVRRQRLRKQEPLDELEMAVNGRHYGLLQQFKLPEMVEATDNFRSSNELGHGGFGTVYKGWLPDGTIIAVKRLKDNRRSTKSDESFLNELEIISKAAHRNLLSLLGFCIEHGERMFVFPFKPNGSVADHLQGHRKFGRQPLTWDMRVKIALGTAQGLAYMHYDCSPKLIHRDVKAANILLNEDYSPVVGDFGLSKLLDYNLTHATTGVQGTLGHIAPEYMESGQMSEKSDVFGFGVFLLELVAGMSAFNISTGPDDVNLREWVVSMLTSGSVRDIVDQELRDGDKYNLRELVQMLQVAIFCMTRNPQDRPTMTECISLLQGNELADSWFRARVLGKPEDGLGHSHRTAYSISENGSELANSIGAFILSGPR